MPRSETSIAMTSVRGIGPLPTLIDSREGRYAADHVFSEVGLPVDVAREADRMLPLNSLIALYEAAAAMTGDPLFGLKAGQEMIDDYGTWVDYSRTAPTLRACLARASKAIEYHQTGTELALSTNGGRALYSYRIFGKRPVHRLQHLQHTIPALLNTFQVYAGDDWRPDWIELDVGYDQRIEELAKRLGAPIRYGSAAMAFAFSSALLDRPRRCQTGATSQIRRHHLKYMVKKGPPRTFSSLVRETIYIDLLVGTAHIDTTADRLGLGPRTLQRRLRAESNTYRRLVTEVRMERAKALLIDTDMPVTEIAHLLGYSDSTHLTRAFSQHVGLPPSAFRKMSVIE